MPDRPIRQHAREIFTGPDTIISSQRGDTSGVDAVNRHRVSTPETLFDSSFEYDLAPLFWDTSLSGGADITHDSDKRAAIMTVSGSVAGTAILQTFAYHPYQKEKSQQSITKFVFGARNNGVIRRIGYFDDSDGIFLEQTNAGLFMVLRSSTSGSVVNVRVAQADWSQNSFDGKGDKTDGAKPFDIDETRRQILDMDIEWGSGRVRYGFDIDGRTIYAHYINNSNVGIAAPYMRSGTLPIRYEIVNSGSGEASELIAISAAVFSEGNEGFRLGRGTPFSANRGILSVSVSSRSPVITIRPKGTFNSLVNRGEIIPISINIFSQSESVLVELVHNGTIFATGGFISADSNSIVEYDLSATVISGGHVVQSFPVNTAGTGANQSGGRSSPILSNLPLTLDIDGNNPLPLSIVCTPLSGTANILPTINWNEVR